MLNLDHVQICIIGLGYVGLPLAVAFGKRYKTIGFDINKGRIDQLKYGIDETLEVSEDEISKACHLIFTHQQDDIMPCNIYIVTVPTPVDEFKRPDFSPLISASELVGKVIKKDAIVIYESTVYPGATEEVCIPTIERISGLKFNQDFFAGYSPERINPGDMTHRLQNIIKITSGSTPAIAQFVDELYSTVISAGTHRASSIKVAEAAKVIENTQRDLNIALINELSIIFGKIGIDTLEVLEAAGSKWNFLPFKPGLVGGHCISVDPYYLTHKAQAIGYHPEVILAGRRINDNMSRHVTDQIVKLLSRKCINIVHSHILVLGLTFKENCPDIRNTRVVDIIEGLRERNAIVDIFDPWVNPEEARDEYGFSLLKNLPCDKKYDGIVICVNHDLFKDIGVDGIKSLCKENHIIYDIKYTLPKYAVDGRP